MTRTLEDYLDLPYAIALVHDRDEAGGEGWVAEVEELPGCISQGRTAEEAVENVRDAMAGWLSVALEDGLTIPEPRAVASYSGRFLVRLGQGLHRDLVRAAEREGVSLNQFVTGVLAGAVGWRSRPASRGADSDLTAVEANSGGRRRTKAASTARTSSSRGR